MKKYTVISNRDIDVSEIDSQLQIETISLTSIPDRAVSVANAHPESKRITSWYLTEEEAENLKNDPRVQNVVSETEVAPELFAEQKANFFRQPVTNSSAINPLQSRRAPKSFPDPDGTHVNWGLERCSNPGVRDYAYWKESLDENGNRRDGPGTLYEDQHLLGLNYQTIYHGVDGTGVDIVIMDQGVQPNHPDLLDEDGNSRVQQINWYDYSDTIDGTLPERFYGKGEYHGTHVACTAAGRKNGWAKNAHIYVMNILGQSSARINDIEEAYELMLAWHRDKTNPSSPRYTGRPTVINMSWGYTTSSMGLPNPETIVYRGVEYDYSNFEGSTWSSSSWAEVYDRFGLVPEFNGSYRLSYQVPAIDALTEELVDAGCTVCIAAGNRGDINHSDPSHPDYNNRVIFPASSGEDDIFYMRPGSPYADGAIMVANLSSACPFYNSPDNPGWEELNASSTRGSSIDIIAPGSKIRAGSEPYTSYFAPIQTETFTARHFVDIDNPNSLFTEQSLSGTSMASPQVTGVAALHLSQKPHLTPAQVKARLLSDAEDHQFLHMIPFTKHRSAAPDYTPTNLGAGYEASVDMPCETTNKLLQSRYAKKPIELKGDFDINSVTAQGSAPTPYETFSTVTVTNNSVKRFNGFKREVIVQIKSDATTNVTESVGDVKLSASHGIFEQVKDNRDGTYTAQYRPYTSTASQEDTIVAQFRANGTPTYKTLTDTASITLTPSTLAVNSGFSPADKISAYPYFQFRYNNPFTAVQTDVDFKDKETEDGPLEILTQGSIGRFDFDTSLVYSGDPILRPKPGLSLSENVIDFNYGKMRYWANMPNIVGPTQQTIQFKNDSGYVDLLTNSVDVLEYHPWHQTSVLEVWPPVAPSDGVAIQEVRLIPKKTDGSPQITYTGAWFPKRLDDGGVWGDSVTPANSRKAYYQEDYLKQDSYLQAETVIHRQDFVSNSPCQGEYHISSWSIIGDSPDTPDYPYLQTAAGEFSDAVDVRRAYYSEITEVPQEGQAINSQTYQLELKQSPTTDDNAIVTVRFYNPTTQQFVTATRIRDNLYQANIVFTVDGRYEVEAQVNGVYCKQRPVFTSSGSDFGTNSILTVSPTNIEGTETAIVTLQARGSAGVDAGASVGPVSMSASKGTITNITDNNDGTYTGTYNPPLDDSEVSHTVTISASFNLYGAVLDTAVISVGSALWHLYSTIEANSDEINANSSTTLTLTIRRSNDNALGTSLGDVVSFTTDKGNITTAEDMGNGTYRTTLSANGESSGNATVTATIFGKTTIRSATVRFVPAADYGLNSVLTTDKTILTGDGSDVATLELQLRGVPGVDYRSPLGEMALSVNVGSLHLDPHPPHPGDIFDIPGYRNDGRYVFYYKPIVTLDQDPQPVNITITLGDIVISRSNIMTIQGVSDTNSSYSFTSGEFNGFTGLDCGIVNHYLFSHPNIYTLEGVGAEEEMGTLTSTTKVSPAIPMGRLDKHMWSNSGRFYFIASDKNDYYVKSADFTGSLNWQVHTQTTDLPEDNPAYNSLSLFRTDASFYYSFGSPQWYWDLPSQQPGFDLAPYRATGVDWNVSLTQDAPINISYSAFSEVTASDSEISGNGTESSIITVALKTSATNYATVSGGTVTLSTNIGTLSNVTDNNDGTYTATFTSLTDGTATISATINGLLIHDTASVTVVEGESNVYTVNSEILIDDNVFDCVDRDVLNTLALMQSVGANTSRNPRINLAFTQLKPNGYQYIDVTNNGAVTSADAFALMTHTTRGSDSGVDDLYDRLAAGFDSLVTQHFDDNSDPLDPLFTDTPNPSMLYADGFSNTVIKVQLKDENGNNVNSSRGAVTFSGDGTFGNVTDNGDGTYSVEYTAPVKQEAGAVGSTDDQYGSAIISARIDGSLLNNTLSIPLLHPNWRNHTVVQGVPSTVISGDSFTMTLVAQRCDGPAAQKSLGLPEEVFTWPSFGSGFAPGELAVIDDGTDMENGTYQYVFTAGTLASTYLLSPQTFGEFNTNVQQYQTRVISAAEQYAPTSELTASPSTIDNGDSSTITLQVKDADGNNITRSVGTVVMTSSSGVGTLGAVTDHQNGTYTAVYTAPAAGSSATTISATISTFAVTDTAAVTISASNFAEQMIITGGTIQLWEQYDPWYGFAYDSANGSYIFGSTDGLEFSPLSGHHVEGLYYYRHTVNGVQLTITNKQVGGSVSEVPDSISTCFTTMKIHNTTFNRTDSNYSTLTVDGTTYGAQWTWSSYNYNPFDTETPGVQRLVTWDPVD